MRQFLALVAAVVVVGGFIAPAAAQTAPSATGRIIIHSGQNPSSTQTNQQNRFERLTIGTALRDIFQNAIGTGIYSNLVVTPNGGMNIAIAPTTGTLGALYQFVADDPNAMPANETTQIPADTTKIVVVGTQNATSGSIGPITAPGSGTSQYFLLEAQLSVVDGANQSVLFINSAGAQSYSTVPTVRANAITYQLKSGTASSTPAVPAADTGWLGVATVLVPSGTATITSGMIAMLPTFTGFVASGSTVTLSSLTISSLSAGCLQSNSSGAITSQPCTSGLGSVAGTFPITASTVSSTATVACPTCVTSVTGSGPIVATPSGSSVALSIPSPIPTALGGTGLVSPAGTTATAPLTVSGTFPNTTVALTGTVPIANGGTGSTTKNFVDLSTAQSIYGAKTLNNALTVGAPVQLTGSTGYTGAGVWGGSSAQLFLGAATGQSIYFANNNVLNGASVSSSGAGVFQSVVSPILVPSTGQLTIGSAAGTNALLVNYGTNATQGMSVYDGGTTNITGTIRGGAGTFLGQITAAGVSSSAGVGVGGALTSATTGSFSSTLTAASATFTNNTGPTVSIGAVGNNIDAFKIGNSISGSSWTQIGTNNGLSAAGIPGSVFYVYSQVASPGTYLALDSSGNLGVAGSYYGTSFNVASRREWKKNIVPLNNALATIMSPAMKVYEWCYNDDKKQSGKHPMEHCKPGQHKHIGPMANHAPTILSGYKHDHIDEGGLAGLTLAAVQQLVGEVHALRARVASLERDRLAHRVIRYHRVHGASR